MKISISQGLSFVLLTGSLGFLSAGCGHSQAAPETTGNYIDDSTITTKVKAALVGDSLVKAADIQVNTTHGEVELTGGVDDSSQKDAAGKDAAGVAGVTDVKNDLTVK
jgi:osmotically-inducible protein OsmY